MVLRAGGRCEIADGDALARELNRCGPLSRSGAVALLLEALLPRTHRHLGIRITPAELDVQAELGGLPWWQPHASAAECRASLGGDSAPIGAFAVCGGGSETARPTPLPNVTMKIVVHCGSHVG